MFKNKENIEYSVDYWRLGLIIYQMFTGKLPFLNKQSILNDEIPGLQELEISSEAKELISSLLNKDLFKRLGSLKNPKKIKEEPFFKEINWKKLKNGVIEPPFKPIVVNIFEDFMIKSNSFIILIFLF